MNCRPDRGWGSNTWAFTSCFGASTLRLMTKRLLKLNHVFRALADPTRRAVLQRLSAGAATTLELARPFDMALPSFAQHLGMLERFGLVKSQKSGRVRTYRLAPKSLHEAEDWILERRKLWESRLDRLDAYVLTMKENDDE